jgi:hypothetical protein
VAAYAQRRVARPRGDRPREPEFDGIVRRPTIAEVQALAEGRHPWPAYQGSGAPAEESGRLSEAAVDRFERGPQTMEPPESTAVPLSKPTQPNTVYDGTERLCLALYGRKPQPRDYLGGSEARMLHDAASALSRKPSGRSPGRGPTVTNADSDGKTLSPAELGTQAGLGLVLAPCAAFDSDDADPKAPPGYEVYRGPAHAGQETSEWRWWPKAVWRKPGSWTTRGEALAIVSDHYRRVSGVGVAAAHEQATTSQLALLVEHYFRSPALRLEFAAILLRRVVRDAKSHGGMGLAACLLPRWPAWPPNARPAAAIPESPSESEPSKRPQRNPGAKVIEGEEGWCVSCNRPDSFCRC